MGSRRFWIIQIYAALEGLQLPRLESRKNLISSGFLDQE